MSKTKHGKLIIIGGHEDKKGDQTILHEVVDLVKDGNSLMILTVATQEPEEVAEEYTEVFKELSVEKVETLDIRTREDAHNPDHVAQIKRTAVLFITGGDQLRITSQLGDTPVFQGIQERYQKGMSIVGTSAGAAVMPNTMLVSGHGDESGHISAIGMAPGLGLIDGVVIDSHFAERGRMGRLLGAVTQNPKNLGLGIDEDTAVIVEQLSYLRVLGSGAVYVVDGSEISYSNLSEDQPEGILTIHDVRLHVLGKGDCFDLDRRRPVGKEETHAEPRAANR